MHEMKKCKKCDAEFMTEAQLRIHFGLSHKKNITVEHKQIIIKPVVNVHSDETITWDPFVIPKRKLDKNRKYPFLCEVCGISRAYIIESGRKICYRFWSTWGCAYSKEMIDNDRKWYRQPCRNRNNYIARPLTPKEKKKLVKQVALLERECWVSLFWTPIEELESWHDDKLRMEYRNLERVRANPC